MNTVRYTARLLPVLIERGQDTLVQCPVYRDGQLAVVTAATSTCTVYDSAGTARATPTVSLVSSIPTATILAATTAGSPYEEGWRVEWRLTLPDGSYVFRTEAYVCKYRLYPVIADIDVTRRLRSLDPTLPASITTRTNYQEAIDEADTEVQLRLLSLGRRPHLIATPSALRQVWLYLAIAIVLESLATQRPEVYTPLAQEWRRRYDAEFTAATAQLDYDDDGQVDTDRTALRPSGVWLC